MIFNYWYKTYWLVTLASTAAFISGCASDYQLSGQNVNICTTNHGQIVTQYNGGNYAYQVCLFEDNRQCSLTALQNKQCPIDGIKIIGYDNPAQIYCAINGGKVLAIENAICTLSDGTELLATKYYQQPVSAIESIGVSK